MSPDSCPVPLVLHYLQSLLDDNRAASTLKVHVAAISAHHVIIDGQPLGSMPWLLNSLEAPLRPFGYRHGT